ncbi:hypothetical protein ACFOM8_21505, partial [Paracoccus angustae]
TGSSLTMPAKAAPPDQVASPRFSHSSAGLAVALWHSGLYAGLIPESVSPCTETGPSCSDRTQMTILGLPIPYLSLGAFSATALCLIFMKGKRP